MTKIKKLFSTPLKAVITSFCIVAILAVVGTGTAFAASAIAKGNAIGAQQAQNFAFADAGIDPATAEIVRTEFEFEKGNFVYEVEFFSNGTEYEYWIKSDDGTVVKKELSLVNSEETNTSVTAKVTLDEAKNISLADAGLNANAVTFIEAKLDLDDGISVYDIEFYTENTKYEYEVNANTGVIYSKSKEIKAATSNLEQKSDNQTSQSADNTSQSGSTQQESSNKISLSTAKSTALSDAGVSASNATFTKAKLDYDDGISVYDIEFYTSTHEYEYEINASTGKIISKDLEAFKTDSSNIGGASFIGVDKAKSIAAKHAGLSVSTVTFSKAKLEKDDGYTVYEIEFYYNGIEYEYTINATSGSIMEYDSERDD